MSEHCVLVVRRIHNKQRETSVRERKQQGPLGHILPRPSDHSVIHVGQKWFLTVRLRYRMVSQPSCQLWARGAFTQLVTETITLESPLLLREVPDDLKLSNINEQDDSDLVS